MFQRRNVFDLQFLNISSKNSWEDSHNKILGYYLLISTDNLLKKKVKVQTQLDKCSESLENFEENCERPTVDNFSTSSLSFVVVFSPLTTTMSNSGKSYHRNVHK